MYLDCASGIAGDMFLAALLDAGLPFDALRDALGSLSVECDLRATRVLRAGIGAVHFAAEPRTSAGHHHHHRHHHHGQADSHSHDHSAHRSLSEIEHLIGHAALPAAARDRAIGMFRRLAAVEAAIHQMPLDQVHLHEVGALDSIVDIVGAAFAMEWLGIDDVEASPLNVGRGAVQIAHGRVPVPAPATLRLLEGMPIYGGDIDAELVTPTGALLVATYVRRFGPVPAMRPAAVGYGAGTRDFPGVPNVLRVLIGEREQTASPGGAGGLGEHAVLKVECEIDDMNPQLYGRVSDALLALGALDVFLTSVVMKKGRPGTLVTVLAPPALREAVTGWLFRETTTLGVRFEPMAREVLERSWVDVEVPGGRVRIKVAARAGEVMNAAPEYDDCERVARSTGRPVKAIQAEALVAWHAGVKRG